MYSNSKIIKETEANNIKLYIFAAARLGSHQTGHLLEKYLTTSFTITVPPTAGRLGKRIVSFLSTSLTSIFHVNFVI